MNSNIRADIEKYGFVNVDVDVTLNLVEEIKKMKTEKNAVILAHYYQNNIIKDLADFVGDSLALAQKAEKTNADIILFAGVNFMGETAKILSPDKKVLVPDLKAGCSLADSCSAKDFAEFRAKYPDAIAISYVNTSAEVKALTDITCTSSNALEIVNSFPKSQKIIFGPDRNLGNYIANKLNRELIIWNGACNVHENFSLQKLLDLKKNFPNSKILSHPECPKEIIEVSDYVGSTAQMLNFSKKDDCNTYIVVTESGILYEMRKECPNKMFIPAPSKDVLLTCNNCDYMRLTSIDKVYNALKYELPEITLDKDLMDKARRSIVKMLEMSAKLGL